MDVSSPAGGGVIGGDREMDAAAQEMPLNSSYPFTLAVWGSYRGRRAASAGNYVYPQDASHIVR